MIGCGCYKQEAPPEPLQILVASIALSEDANCDYTTIKPVRSGVGVEGKCYVRAPEGHPVYSRRKSGRVVAPEEPPASPQCLTA